MTTIQVEALEAIKSDGYVLEAEDRVTLDEAAARRWCGAGWAKAVRGEIETGERKVVKAVIEPAGAQHGHTAEEVKTHG